MTVSILVEVYALNQAPRLQHKSKTSQSKADEEEGVWKCLEPCDMYVSQDNKSNLYHSV